MIPIFKNILKLFFIFVVFITIFICIFFIPTIIDFIFDVVGGLSEEMHEDYENCFNCLTHPDSCDTSYDPNDLNNDAIYPAG